MAEEILNNPDNLETESSPINQLLSKSDFLNQATIEQPLAPKINWQDNFVNTTNYIKDNTSGISPNYPPSHVKENRVNGVTDGGFGAILDKGFAEINNKSDVSNYAEPYAYDAGPKGTFRARYKAYGQDTFNKIGFHPLIDNETFFNQNTTFGDDLQRWATHSAWPMLSKGFMDPIKSYKSIIDGNGLFDADPQSARDYEYYNALGASTKGGLGGFTVNMFNSASYSMGILLEGAVEGTLIGGLFGGGNVATGAIEGGSTFLNKLGSLPKALVETSRATGLLLSDVKNFSNLSKAKELYKSAGQGFKTFMNPLHNTTTALKQLKDTDNLTNLARSATTAGALWHDVMSMNMALSEGKLEGGFTRYQTYDKLYNKFVEENNGRGPGLEEQEAMMRQASKGSFWNTLNNTGLIFYSNKLVFPSLTNASFLKGIPKFGFGKVVTNVGKEFQVLFKPGKTALEGTFVKQRINFVNAIKSLVKPATYGKVGLNYFKANVVEGAQEVLQDVLQETTQNYYVDTFKNSDARNYRYASGLLGDAIGKQIGAQGLETFLSGFLMGTVLQAPGVMKKYATIGYNDYLKKDANYKSYLDGREELADTVVEQLNTINKNAKYFFDPKVNNYANIALLNKVIDNSDEHTTKEIRDAEFATFNSAVLSSLQNGTFNMFLKHYEGYKQASPTDLEEAWGLAPGQGVKALERFDKSLENAKKISNRWDTAKDKMKFMANLDDYEKDTEQYKMAEVYNIAYNQALYNYVFLHENFDKNITREQKLYDQLASLSVIKESPFADFTGLTDPNRLQREIEMMKTEVENLESFGTGESLDLATRKRELLELYSNFQDRQEKLVDLFINKSLLDNVKAEILKENPEMSLDDVSLKAIDTIIEQYDNGNSNEFLDYKESFSDLLMGLAGDSKKRMQLEQELQEAGGIDELFDSLLDTHVLRNESAKLAQYVNLLSNPRDFYEHVMRNFKFMKDLYNNREEIVKDIVNQEISAIERNTLLNTLADQGIFVDLEEFNKFIEDPRYFPEYFIDVTNNRMINKGSLLYEEYIGVFMKAAQLAEKKPAGDPLSQKQVLDKRLQDLENERGEKLEAERIKYETKFRDKYGMSEAEYTQQESERVASEELSDEDRKAFEKEKELITKAIDKLASDNYVDVQAAAEVLSTEVLEKQGINALEFFSEQEEVQKADKEKNKAIFNLSQKYDTSDIEDEQEAFGTRIDAALKATIYTEYANVRLAEIETELSKKATAPVIDIKNTKEYLTYQEIVDQINDQYDELAAEIKDDFKKKGIDENTADVYTTKTDFEDFDLPFQTEITDLFDTYLVDVLQEPLSIKTTNPVEYDRLRANWLERQSPLVESFNNIAKQNSLDRANKLSQPPVLKFISTKINAQTTTYVISSIIKRFQKFLENGSYPNTKGKQVQLTPEDISNIKDDIEGLNGYLNARVSAAGPRNIAEQTIEIIQEYVINKQDELVDVTDEDGNVIGRTFKDRGPNDPMPARSTQVAEEVETTLLNKDPFEYNAIKDTVNDDGDIVPSPVENLYNQFFNDPEVQAEDKIRLFMEAFKKKAYQSGKGGWKQFRYQEKLDAVQNSLDTVGTLDDLKRTIQKYAFKESSDAGDYVDTLIRQFLTLNASSKSNFNEFTYDDAVEVKGRMMKISDMMSRKVFDKLFAPVSITNPGGIVTKFRLGIVDGTYTILSENVKLFDRNLRDGNGVTGELDLLLVREDGSVAIVDIKTSTEYKWKEFGKGTQYDKSTYFRAQQSIYGTMFHNNTAITPDLKLMPFSVTLSEDKIGYIEDIELASIVPDGQDTIDLEYLPEVENFGIIKITPEIKAPIKKGTSTSTNNKADIERIKQEQEQIIELSRSINPGITAVNSYNDSINKGVWASKEEAIDAMNAEMEEVSDWIDSMVDAGIDVQEIINKVGSITQGKGKASGKLLLNQRLNIYNFIKSKSKGEITDSLIDIINSSEEQINDYYNAELAALGTTQPSTSVSTDAKADVILPIGTSGSGKSTFIKSLPQENLVVISPDDMRVEFTGDINNKSKDKEIYEEAAKRAVAAIQQGKQVVFDTTNLTKDKRRPFIEAIKKAIPNANIQYKLMELNPELAKQRIKAQIARGENRANVSDETIDRHAESYKQMLEDIKSEGITNYDTETTTEEGIKESDPIKNKIGENVNQPVIYNGRVGKLVLMPSAEFGVEIVINDDISTLQLTLDTLDANLTLEKQYGTEETISELEKNVKRISEAIKSAKGFTQVFPLQIAGKNVSNGLLKLSDAGVSLVIATDSVGQVSTINGEVINASFSNKDESIANINGVRYDVLRDATGNITVLSYFSKDEEISKIDKQIGDYAQKIGSLRNSLSTEDIESTTKDDIISRIADLQEQIKQLNNKRVSLAEANNKMYIYGENANDYIFALNRLPNGFQRATAKATKANETQDLKSIENLSLSRAIATTITEILSENYPEVLDTLIEDGVQAVKRADLKTITNWAKESITKLESLGYSVINRGDIVDDITNQINALNELLNDLASINLTKNGRISKKQETADQLFGPGNKEVQNRSSVPKNEGTTGTTTKGVSRPATTTELQELVKQSRKEGLGETFEEPVETEDVSDAITEINNATLDTIDEVYEKAFLDAQKNGTNASQIVAAYKTKLEELKTIVSIQNVDVDEYLISKNPIFTDISDEVVIVVKKKKDLITLKNIKTEESRDFTEDELIDNFEKTTMEAREPEVPVEITPVDIEDSNESKDTIKEIMNDKDALAKAKAQSKASDKKSRLDKLGENSKTC